MNVNVKYCNKMDESLLLELRKEGDKALDYLWNQPLIKHGLQGLSADSRELIEKQGERLKNIKGSLVVIANGVLYDYLKVFFSNLSNSLEKKIILTGNSLSSSDYEKLIGDCENEEFSILAIGQGEVTVSEKAAYATLKNILLSKYGGQASAEKITFLGTKESSFYSDQAEGDDLPIILYDEDIDLLSVAFLLPLYVAGYSIDELAKAVYDLVASPAWDSTAKDYSVVRSHFMSKGYCLEELAFFQREFDSVAELLSNEEKFNYTRKLLPWSKLKAKGQLLTLLEVEEGHLDIMTPNFPGASEDGSLNQLVKGLEDDLTQKAVDLDIPTFRIGMNSLNPYNLIQLLMLLKISSEISYYLLNK